MKKGLIGLAALLSVSCAEDWDCRNLDILPYGEFSAEIKICDWGNESFELDNADVIFLKIKDKNEKVVCEGELTLTDEDFVFNVKSFSCGTVLKVKPGTIMQYTLGGICFKEFDVEGNEIKLMCDNTLDTNIDSVIVREFDDENRVVLESIDFDNDNVFDEIKKISYHDNGKIALEIVKKDNYEIKRYFSIEGKKVRENRIYEDFWLEDYFDEKGRLIVELNHYKQGISKAVQEYNERDQIVSLSADVDNDGSIEWKEFYFYKGEVKVAKLKNRYIEDGVLKRRTLTPLLKEPMDSDCPNEEEYMDRFIDFASWNGEKTVKIPDGKFDYVGIYVCRESYNTLHLIPVNSDLEQKFKDYKGF